MYWEARMRIHYQKHTLAWTLFVLHVIYSYYACVVRFKLNRGPSACRTVCGEPFGSVFFSANRATPTCDCPIDCQVNNTVNTVKAQKSMKDIVKNAVTSKLCHHGFTKLREYFLYAKKTKITTLFNNSSPPLHRSYRPTFWRISARRK